MIGTTISNYQILGQLGSGGMGVVYKARDTRLDRDVALKFLPPELSRDDEANERFVQEAKAASALHHPNICAIYDIKETEDGRLYIVMPLYEGQTLKHRLGLSGSGTPDAPLPIAQAVDIARQIAAGLGAAHQRGIVHRDIKPANIMVTDQGQAVILDFGVAKLAGGLDLTRTGSTVGTAYYMSPEQIRGDLLDGRSDLWSLGVLFYQMLTGKRPFDGAYEQAVSYGILNSEPADIRVLRPDASSQIAGVVERLLSKDPNDRFGTAQELVTALSARHVVMDPDRSPVAPPRRDRPHFMLGKPSVIGIAVLLIAAVGFFTAKRLGVWSPGSAGDAEHHKARLVVLPFDNLGAPEDEYFSDGMTDEITQRLSAVGDLAVISRNTAAHYKNAGKTIREIGNELNVDYVLGGTVRWDKGGQGGDRVRITPELIRVTDDTNLWSEIYDRTIEGVFGIQTEVAENVVDQLNVTLLDRERNDLARLPTSNMEAYEAYLRGIALWRSETVNMSAAIASFETALTLDSTFVQAAYEVAHLYLQSIWLGDPTDRDRYLPKAQAMIERVSRLAPNSGEEHLARGYFAYYIDLDFRRALQEFEAALVARPGESQVRVAIALIKRRLGKLDEAAADLVSVLNEDPQNYQMSTEVAMTFFMLKRHGDADRWFDKAIQLQPSVRGLYCFKAENLLASGASTQRARNVENALPESEGGLPCWWADLADRHYDAIISKLASVDPSQLGIDVWGDQFHYTESYLYFEKAIVFRLHGDARGEHEAWQKLFQLVSGPAASLDQRMQRYRNSDAVGLLGLAVAHAGLGHRDEARRLLQLVRNGVAHDAMLSATSRRTIALAHALIGDKDEAIDLLKEDLNGYGYVTPSMLALPFWDSLRDEPRFKALIADR